MVLNSKGSLASAATRRRHRPDQAIERRRANEAYLDSYKALTKQNFTLRRFAEWEEQTDQAIQRNQVRHIAKQLQSSQQHRLNHRRKQLRALLDSDAETYQAELDALKESPAECRERLRAKAKQIRDDKDRLAKEFVQEQYRKQFRNSCDELRTNEGKNLQIICDRDRRQQLELKALYKDLEKREEDKWARLWEQDRQSKIQRDAIEEEARKQMDKKTYEEIDSQVLALQQERQALEQKKREETAARIEQLRLDEQKAEEDARDSRTRAAEHRLEIARFNQEFQARKEAERQRQQEEDRKLLQNALEEEAAATADEKLLKQTQAKDMQEYLAYREKERQRKARLEMELDTLRKIELDKAAHKQDMVWEKERLAREKLMKEVYETRHMQMLEKAASQRKEQEESLRERDRLKEQLQGDQGGEGDRIRDRRKKEAMADTLRRQMEDNKYRREMDSAERLYEGRAADLAEQRYQEHLEREREIDRKNLGQTTARHNLKSMNWWS